METNIVTVMGVYNGEFGYDHNLETEIDPSTGFYRRQFRHIYYDNWDCD